MAAKKKVSKTAAKRKPVVTAKAKKPAKASVKKPAAKKVKAAPKVVKLSTVPVKSAYSKSQVAVEIAEHVGITRKQVSEVFNVLTNLIDRHVKKGGPGIFNMPGLLKINTIRKPATKARKGINPFTGEACTFKAKPARTVVKVRALKGLKDMA